eukprot:6211196-Pleurochrysis_carterae.AAC.1
MQVAAVAMASDEPDAPATNGTGAQDVKLPDGKASDSAAGTEPVKQNGDGDVAATASADADAIDAGDVRIETEAEAAAPPPAAAKPVDAASKTPDGDAPAAEAVMATKKGDATVGEAEKDAEPAAAAGADDAAQTPAAATDAAAAAPAATDMVPAPTPTPEVAASAEPPTAAATATAAAPSSLSPLSVEAAPEKQQTEQLPKMPTAVPAPLATRLGADVRRPPGYVPIGKNPGVRIARRATQLTEAWLTDVFRLRKYLTPTGKARSRLPAPCTDLVTKVEIKPLGDGLGVMGDLALVFVDLEGAQNNAPTKMVAKFSPIKTNTPTFIIKNVFGTEAHWYNDFLEEDQVVGAL